MQPSDPYDPLFEAVFGFEFSSYYDYLETIVSFLDHEREEHDKSIDEIDKKLRSGEIKYPDDEDQMPPEFEFDYFRLHRISEFENTLFNSFFLTIFIHLEAELAHRCRALAKQNPRRILLSDLKGMNSVKKFMNYLTKVQEIDFSVEKSREWEKILGYNLLRNCIVHNQGKIDDGFGEQKELIRFIKRPDSKLELSDTLVVLNKDFCLDALDTIKKFLYSVTWAKAKTQ